MNGNTPAMQIQNVRKTMGNKVIINDVSLDIYPGEVFGFLGPNGAGKTTTIRMLVGLISMDGGRVLIKGKDVQKDFEQAISQVGAIVENPELYDFLSGYQNVMHFSRMAGNTSEDRMLDVIELVGLENAIHAKVKTYSLGMRQRLGLAQALIHSPSVLILDEPMNGLDPAGIRELRQHLEKLTKERGMAVLVSSHLLAEMELMCDRIGIIQHGKLIDVQSVHDFVETEVNLTVTLTAEPIQLAKTTLQETFPEIVLNEHDNAIDIQLNHEQVPRVIKCLVNKGVSIYGVETVSKTLEDKFMEVTGGQPIV